MRSKWMFVLIGNDKTGKTRFQKHLLEELCHQDHWHRLTTNTLPEIRHPRVVRKLRTISTANRSYQELISRYTSVDNYFTKYFKDADVAVVSSHVTHGNHAKADAAAMIRNGHERLYNVCGVFFENSIQESPKANREFANLDWDERWLVENPHTSDEDAAHAQIRAASLEFVQMLIQRAPTW